MGQVRQGANVLPEGQVTSNGKEKQNCPRVTDHELRGVCVGRAGGQPATAHAAFLKARPDHER